MSWALMIHNPSVGLAWVQWVDREKADAWKRECARLLAKPAPPAQATSANVRAQADATVALWKAVHNWLLACDLPYPVFVPYVRAVMVTNPQTWRPQLIAALRRFSPDYPNEEATVDVSMRLYFDVNGVNVSWLTSAVAPTPTQGLDYQRTGFSAIDNSIWSAWVFSEWYPGAFEAGSIGAVSGLVPLREMYELGRTMAGFIAGRSTEDGIDACRNYAAVKNFAEAKRLDPTALPAEAAELIISTASADQLLNTRVSPALTDIAAIGAAGSAALGPLAPFAALAAGILGGLGAALQGIFGTAVGYNVDAFQRRQPVLEKTAISGVLRIPMSASTPPTQEVPMPLGLPPLLITEIVGGGPGYHPPEPPVVTIHPQTAGKTSTVVKLGALALLALLASSSK